MEKKCLLLLESPRDEDQRKISRTQIVATVVSAGARPLPDSCHRGRGCLSLGKVHPDHPGIVKLRKASGMAGRFIPALNPLSSLLRAALVHLSVCQTRRTPCTLCP